MVQISDAGDGSNSVGGLKLQLSTEQRLHDPPRWERSKNASLDVLAMTSDS